MKFAFYKSKLTAAEKINELKREAERKNLMLYITVGSILLLLALFIVTLFAFTTYKRNQKAKKVIADKNDELQRQRISELMKEEQLKFIKGRVEGQESERRRIAKELHDGIGGTLSGIKLNLIKIGETYSGVQSLDGVIEILDRACHEVRTTSHNLAPPVFFDAMFTDVIENFVTKVTETLDIKVQMEFFPKRMLNAIPESIQVDVYRIIQELMNNILKHAQATSIDIQMIGHKEYLNIIVEDNGVGFVLQGQMEGIGLQSIQSRIDALQGDMKIDAQLGRGTLVNLDIPFE